MKKISVVLVLLLVFTSCDEEVKSLVFKTDEVTIKSEAEINVLLTKATSNSDIATKINTTIDNKIVKSISDAEDLRSLEKALLEFDKEFTDFKTDFAEDEQSWTLDIESELTYQSPEIISIALSIYSDKGGAHGNDTIEFLNFNPNTGELFSMKDMIKDLAGFKTLAETYFNDSIKSDFSDSTNTEDLFFGKPFQLPKNIGFTEDGLVLLYNVYEIASYNQGYSEFVIPFDAAKPYLKVN